MKLTFSFVFCENLRLFSCEFLLLLQSYYDTQIDAEKSLQKFINISALRGVGHRI